jgi:APA family basic amino acid/polyamine antiporter
VVTVSDRHPNDRLERQLGLGDAVWLIVASVIGAGIFFTPGRVAQLLPAPDWILAVWVAGGLVSLAGALAMAELGGMYPHAGGDYVYLREAFHPLAGFLVGWLSFFVIYTGTIAALAAAFATGMAGLFDWPGGAELPIAVGVTVAVSVLHYGSVRWGARANNVTSILKVVALLAFSILGPWLGDGDWNRLWAEPLDPDGSGASSVSLSAFGLAMSPVLFSYLGWNASIYLGSEIRSPGRNIPRSLFVGLAICTVVYLLVNAVYLYALPLASLVGASDTGTAAASALFGPRAGSIIAVLVLLSVLGTLSATVMVGPRIAYAMALDGLFFSGVETVSDARRTPAIAITVQAGVSVGLLWLLRTFPSALDYTTFAIILATIADTLALYRLRRRMPGHGRPYRAWGYPWLPGVYLVVNVGLAASLLWGRPVESVAGLAMLAVGWPFYHFFVRSGLRRRAREGR